MLNPHDMLFSMFILSIQPTILREMAAPAGVYTIGFKVMFVADATMDYLLSKDLKALTISSGVDRFHSLMPLAGKSSDSFSAIGQLIFRLPVITMEIKDCLTSRCSAILCCVIRFIVTVIIYPESICQGFFITKGVFFKFYY